ncbi:MAG: two-component sensor histidine kinase [Phycisphaeraceae bacterium]|nr:two-component sensor histidine kinase [Phycisphaeraceae bacterium]
MMWELFIGLSLGVALAIPLALVWARRTERRVRQLEARARAAERLAALGSMTGGLAHEIKNPLSTIGLNVQLLQEDLSQLSEDLPGVGRMQRRGDSLRRETQRLREILEDFLRYAGRMPLDREPLDVNRLVDELIDFFEPQAAEAGARLRTQLAAGPLNATLDGNLIKQALLNLLINATQAMAAARDKKSPHGGCDELMIRTEAVKPANAPAVRITVTDTGPGMTPQVVDRVFEPYYSTKPGGTGLGLPTSRRIAEEHGGTLTVHSEPGRGTSFVLTLPTDVD